MKFLERRSCLGQEAKGEGTGHRAGQGSTDIPRQIQPEKRGSAWTRCVWTGEITFSPTWDLEADQATEAFTTTFGWGGMKRQLLSPFCLATFLIFSRGVAALHPAHCVCVSEEFTAGGKKQNLDILVEFFSPVFSKWMQQPANPLLAAGSSGTTVLAGRMQRAEGRFVEPPLKGARGILDVLVLNRRMLEVLVWNRSILVWSRRCAAGNFLVFWGLWSIHPVLASWEGEGGMQ